ncbi:hypothetical protein EVAR_53070_1 [Eumeta japonica]|uniref:Uncharacterized protein n=1 Tax=Eumeta variegata TaxID=151549 RepID=A0A4C1YWL1_EUMVA|nr:hypothetical protein EVAR_53070_1 [Eumeta japonica]
MKRGQVGRLPRSLTKMLEQLKGLSERTEELHRYRLSTNWLLDQHENQKKLKDKRFENKEDEDEEKIYNFRNFSSISKRVVRDLLVNEIVYDRSAHMLYHDQQLERRTLAKDLRRIIDHFGFVFETTEHFKYYNNPAISFKGVVRNMLKYVSLTRLHHCCVHTDSITRVQQRCLTGLDSVDRPLSPYAPRGHERYRRTGRESPPLW